MSGATLRRGDWLAIGTALGGAATVSLLVLLPLHKGVRDRENEIANKELVVQQDALVQAQHEVAQRNVASAREFVEGWRSRSGGGQALSVLFGQIATLAKDSGATVTRFEPQTTVELERLRRVPLEIACQGTFEAVFALVRELESLPRDIWIEELEISHAEAGQTVQCEMKLAILADKPDFSD